MENARVRERGERIVEEFSALDDWVERYRHLLAQGEELPGIPAEERTEEHYVGGCQYDLWIEVSHDPERDMLRFRADSDAKLVKGLAALIIRALDGQPPRAVVDADLEFLDAMDLRAHLSAQRRNGLAAMVHQIKARARELHDASAGTGAAGGDSSGGGSSGQDPRTEQRGASGQRGKP